MIEAMNAELKIEDEMVEINLLGKNSSSSPKLSQYK
jgi:hypothetical protein